MHTLAALAEPTRRRIVETLGDSESTVGQLVSTLDLGQPLVSRHLQVLRRSGLVDVRVDGSRRWYRLRPDPFEDLEQWLSSLHRAWDQRLNALEHHLDGDGT